MLGKKIMGKIIRNFEEKRIEKNHKKLIEKMVEYHKIVNPEDTPLQHLVNAAVDVERAKNRGVFNEKYEPMGMFH